MTPEDDETGILAGQYVLGALSLEDAAAVERALPHDKDLRAAVEFWKARLAALDPLAPRTAPSSDLWARIEHSVRVGGKAGDGLAHPPTPANDNILKRTGFWQLSTGVAAAAALLLAVLPGRSDPAGQPTPSYAAVLQAPESRDVTWLVQAEAGGQVRLTPVGTPSIQDGRTFQFWTKAVGAERPVSLGVVAVEGRARVDSDRLPALAPGQLFEVTLEPYGGSRTGLPTGPVLGVGKAIATSDT